jgi:hypothetical protein
LSLWTGNTHFMPGTLSSTASRNSIIKIKDRTSKS